MICFDSYYYKTETHIRDMLGIQMNKHIIFNDYFDSQ